MLYYYANINYYFKLTKQLTIKNKKNSHDLCFLPKKQKKVSNFTFDTRKKTLALMILESKEDSQRKSFFETVFDV